jgi:hypothetical protein
MPLDAALLQFIQWAVKTGLIPAGTAVLLVVFCLLVIWMARNQSKDFGKALTALKEANIETNDEIREQVKMQGTHIEGCEKRYEQLRMDMSIVQKQVAETHNDVWKEVIAQLRSIKG